jgi:glycerate dehydrogenase
LTQHVHGYDARVKTGAWSTSQSFTMFDYPLRELANQKLGIIGYGALGRAVAKLGESFGMDILVARRPGQAASLDSSPVRVPFERVIAEADFISLHCPLNEATKSLLGSPEFASMKRNAVIINTARGGLIDSAALLDALRRGQIAGAGLDVLPVEPPTPDDPLLNARLPNLILTPHIAWAAQEARQRALEQVAENISDYVAGRELRRGV